MAFLLLADDRPRRPREIPHRLRLVEVPDHKVSDYRLNRRLIEELVGDYERSEYFLSKDELLNDSIPADTEVNSQ